MATAWAIAMFALISSVILDFIIDDHHLRHGVNVVLWLFMLVSFIWGIVVLTT